MEVCKMPREDLEIADEIVENQYLDAEDLAYWITLQFVEHIRNNPNVDQDNVYLDLMQKTGIVRRNLNRLLRGDPEMRIREIVTLASVLGLSVSVTLDKIPEK